MGAQQTFASAISQGPTPVKFKPIPSTLNLNPILNHAIADPTSHTKKDYGVALEAQALGNIVAFALCVEF